MNVVSLVQHRVTKWIVLAMFGVSIAIGVNQFIIAMSIVNGTSMQPTLHDGDRLLVNKFSFLFHTPQRGDVVTFQDPSNENRYLVKRVIGVPTDRIEIRDGKLLRNGQVVTEPYIDTRIEDGDYGPIVVQKGTIFVMGDNRHRFASRDSRYDTVGQVSVKLIEGKVEWILWRPSLSAHL
ncbi:signal peptidase I [Thermoactinomyces sp. DSM 45892]|uniref:signal peptidase I n=1 Tax=Thermoactinomyces sp. DSM 45892 TaxID=1882753 RepID=UPI00089D53F9|nr:signal peptidase I [Thermoactinomyces sp. DSM 45892]SDZ26647.1 signal peptidase I [Thermoactinomyces sp. DSM 45892]